ncbi:MAG: imelysin family protein, partial [Balneolaceae bacterium]
MKKILLCLFAASLPLFVHSCTGDDPSGPDSADFDRQAMLENWADNIIIPAFASFSGQTGQLRTAADAFSAEPTQQTLDDLRQAWGSAYISFQHVSMFEMGRGMELRNYLNIYPACTSESNQGLTPEEKCSPEIRENIEEGSYNLELPSQYDSQGFPA